VKWNNVKNKTFPNKQYSFSSSHFSLLFSSYNFFCAVDVRALRFQHRVKYTSEKKILSPHHTTTPHSPPFTLCVIIPFSYFFSTLEILTPTSSCHNLAFLSLSLTLFLFFSTAAMEWRKLYCYLFSTVSHIHSLEMGGGAVEGGVDLAVVNIGVRQKWAVCVSVNEQERIREDIKIKV
jgi:hypothetical protein